MFNPFSFQKTCQAWQYQHSALEGIASSTDIVSQLRNGTPTPAGSFSKNGLYFSGDEFICGLYTKKRQKSKNKKLISRNIDGFVSYDRRQDGQLNLLLEHKPLIVAARLFLKLHGTEYRFAWSKGLCVLGCILNSPKWWAHQSTTLSSRSISSRDRPLVSTTFPAM